MYFDETAIVESLIASKGHKHDENSLRNFETLRRDFQGFCDIVNQGMSSTDFQVKNILYKNVNDEFLPIITHSFSTKPRGVLRGSKVRACPNSDLGEFLF